LEGDVIVLNQNKYKDYKFINLLGRQSQRMKHIKGREQKIEEIDKQILKLNKQKMKHKNQIMIWNSDLKQINQVIKQTTKLQKSDDSITIRKEKTRIRGFVRLYGKLVSIHIGSYHKKGLFHTDKLLKDMSNGELCDEFRFKLSQKVGDSKMRFFSDSYMKKRRKKQKEKRELREEFRQKEKEGKIDYYTEGGTDTKSSSSVKGMDKLRKK